VVAAASEALAGEAPPPAVAEAPPAAKESSAEASAPAVAEVAAPAAAEAPPSVAEPALAARGAAAAAPSVPSSPPAQAATPPAQADAATAEVGPAAAPARAPGEVAAAPDRLGRLAGQLAIAAAVLLVAGLLPSYQWGTTLRWVSPEAVAPVLILAALAATAGACTLVLRGRRVVGPGLLLGAAPAAISGLLNLVGENVSEDGFELGFTLLLVAELVLVLAACLAGLALARTAQARLLGGFPSERLRWLVALLGAAGAVPLAIFAARLLDFAKGWVAAPVVWMVVMALVVPACVALAAPRQFAVALLAGWIGGATSAAVYYFSAALVELNKNGYDVGRGLIAAFGATLLALAVVAVLLARAGPAATADRPAPR
jgi:hypothetical protein